MTLTISMKSYWCPWPCCIENLNYDFDLDMWHLLCDFDRYVYGILVMTLIRKSADYRLAEAATYPELLHKLIYLQLDSTTIFI